MIYQVHGNDAISVAAGEPRYPLPSAFVVQGHDVRVDAALCHNGAERRQVRGRIGAGGGGGVIGAAVGGEIAPALKLKLSCDFCVHGTNNEPLEPPIFVITDVYSFSFQTFRLT